MQNKILPATNRNYPELINVWEASVRETHHFLSEADLVHYKLLILEQYFDQLSLFCIKINHQIIGFIGIDQGLIQMLFVHPKTRGTGIGKTLINFAIDAYQINSVDVNEQNEQAVGFYKHMGFDVTERFNQDAAGKPYPILNMTLKSTND